MFSIGVGVCLEVLRLAEHAQPINFAASYKAFWKIPGTLQDFKILTICISVSMFEILKRKRVVVVHVDLMNCW